MTTDPKTKFPAPGKKENTQKYPGYQNQMVTKPDVGTETYAGSSRLTGKRALITGGDSGIGRAVATAFAKEGADVVISHLPEEQDDADETVAELTALGRKVVSIAGDLRDQSFTEGLVDAAVVELGGLDILVNNAALQRYFKKLDDITAEDFEEIFRINVVAPFILSQAAAKIMEPGASIINTVSIEAYSPDFILLPYATSKGAFTAFTKGLAENLIEKGIRVNAVAPGPIWSPLNTHASPPEKLKAFGEETKFKRPGQPVELAPVYVLLASDEASYITGEIYGVTGGEGIA